MRCVSLGVRFDNVLLHLTSVFSPCCLHVVEMGPLSVLLHCPAIINLALEPEARMTSSFHKVLLIRTVYHSRGK